MGREPPGFRAYAKDGDCHKWTLCNPPLIYSRDRDLPG